MTLNSPLWLHVCPLYVRLVAAAEVLGKAGLLKIAISTKCSPNLNIWTRLGPRAIHTSKEAVLQRFKALVSSGGSFINSNQWKNLTSKPCFLWKQQVNMRARDDQGSERWLWEQWWPRLTNKSCSSAEKPIVHIITVQIQVSIFVSYNRLFSLI